MDHRFGLESSKYCRRYMAIVLLAICWFGTAGSWTAFAQPAAAPPATPWATGEAARPASPAGRQARQAPSQTPAPIVTRQPLFSIPFFINPNSPQRPDKVHLFVSGDQGRNWTRYQTRSTQQNRFDFQAGQDGEYWFVVRTQEDPKLLDQPRPEKVVVVDRRPPELALEVSIGPTDEIVAEWDARDPNLKASTFRLEYRLTPTDPWKPVAVQPVRDDATGDRYVGKLPWVVSENSQSVEVRAEIFDRAGNSEEVTRQQKINRVAAATTAPSPRPTLPTATLPERTPIGSASPRVNSPDVQPLDEPPVETSLTTTPPGYSTSPRATAAPEPRVPTDDLLPPPAYDPNASEYQSPLGEPLDEPLGLATTAAPQTEQLRSDSEQASTLPPIKDRPKLTPRRRRLPWQQEDASEGNMNARSLADGNGQRRSLGTPQATRQADAGDPDLGRVTDATRPTWQGAPSASRTESDLSPATTPRPRDLSGAGFDDLDPGPYSAPPTRESLTRPSDNLASDGRQPSTPNVPEQDLPAAGYQPPVAGVDGPMPPSLERQAMKNDQSPMNRGPEPVANSLRPIRNLPPMTSSRIFDLDYDVTDLGSSPVARVELWYTEDGGETWRAHGVDPDRTSPYRVEFDREGLYGFRLLVHNELGAAARPPQPGDEPDLTVGIDWSKPKTHVDEAVFTNGAGTQIKIRWRADDEYLAERPISIAFAPEPNGPWYPVANEIDNRGEYVWTPDHALPRKVYIRVSAKDRAGNVGHDKMLDPVDFGELAPRGRIRQFRPQPQ